MNSVVGKAPFLPKKTAPLALVEFEQLKKPNGKRLPLLVLSVSR
jgi:hypothetical protein